jgi:putative acetyltransferase
MQIREERPDDVSRIAHIQYVAFTGHPLHAKGAQPVEHRIVERLRAAHALTLSLLAEVGKEAVGHIALSPAIVGEARSGWFLLGPVGVLPENRSMGVGAALVRASLERMCDMGAAGVVLVGDPGFYVRLGFANVPGLVYQGVPDRFVLAACFRDAIPQGGIIAHEAFGAPGA